MTPEKRYTIAETVELLGISFMTLSRLRSNGLIPLPEKRGRTHTYTENQIEKMRPVLVERKAMESELRSQILRDRWQDPGQRGVMSFNNLVTAQTRPKRTKFSPEFLSSQGRLKDPDKLEGAKAAYQEFLKDPVKVARQRQGLVIAANKPETRAKKSESMKRRMAEKRAELEALKTAATQNKGGRPRNDEVRTEVQKLRAQNKSWAQIQIHMNRKTGKMLTANAYRNLAMR